MHQKDFYWKKIVKRFSFFVFGYIVFALLTVGKVNILVLHISFALLDLIYYLLKFLWIHFSDFLNCLVLKRIFVLMIFIFCFESSLANFVVFARLQTTPAVLGSATNQNLIILSFIDWLVDQIPKNESILFENLIEFLKLSYFFDFFQSFFRKSS